MTPYEILLSESQERMLVVALRGHERDVRAILAKWDLEAEVIGEVIAEPVYRVTEGERVVAEFPGSRLVTDCPRYSPAAWEDPQVATLEAVPGRVRGVQAGSAVIAARFAGRTAEISVSVRDTACAVAIRIRRSAIRE